MWWLDQCRPRDLAGTGALTKESAMPNAPKIWEMLPRKLVVILRGLRPEDAAATVTMLIENGFDAIEVPLNRDDALDAVEIAVATAGGIGM